MDTALLEFLVTDAAPVAVLALIAIRMEMCVSRLISECMDKLE